MPHSRAASWYQDGGDPIGSRIVEDLLKDAEPAIAGMPDPAKIKNLLRLDRLLLELYVSRGPGHHGLYQAQGRVRVEVEAREMLARNEAYHRSRLASEKILDDAYRAADQLSADATTDADAKLRKAGFSAEARAAALAPHLAKPDGDVDAGSGAGRPVYRPAPMR